MSPMSRAAQQRFRLTTPGRRVMRAPKPDDVLGVIEYLPRDGHVLLESMDEPEVYIQVWLRPEGSYQLELRDGSVETHLQTRSACGDGLPRPSPAGSTSTAATVMRRGEMATSGTRSARHSRIRPRTDAAPSAGWPTADLTGSRRNDAGVGLVSWNSGGVQDSYPS